MTRTRPKVIVTNWVHDEVRRYLESFAEIEANMDRTTPWSADEIAERGADAEAMLAFMTDSVDAALLARLPALKMISCAVRGYDNFHLEACRARGIQVAHVPDLLQGPTADLTLGLIISLTRNMLAADRFVRSGHFAGWRPHFYGLGLAGTPVGIIGMGGLGQAIARRLLACDADVSYFDETVPALPSMLDGQMSAKPLEQILAESQVVILALPLTAETRHVIDEAALCSMKTGAYLINPARGSLVDEMAVAEAIKAGRLQGYAADVFALEDWALKDRPKSIPRDLIEARDRTVFTPHLGSAVDAVRFDIAMAAARHLEQFFKGEEPDGLVPQARFAHAELSAD